MGADDRLCHNMQRVALINVERGTVAELGVEAQRSSAPLS